MTKDEQLRYSRHMIMPEVGAFCASARVGSVRQPLFISLPPVSENWAWSISMMSILAICSGRFCTAPRMSAEKNWIRPGIVCET